MRKHYTDKERFDVVKHFKRTDLSQAAYAKKYNIARTTLSHLVAVYNHI